ncbi:hypothetical protein [Bowmanella denitrificans]|uniref:hypothetical protein n=1 Tax=Bowmanella denitrificans TaxID=366582 RepID=UPI000C9B6FF2|nr:hypothetical protein [Bowmanella denitrificans]
MWIFTLLTLALVLIGARGLLVAYRYYRQQRFDHSEIEKAAVNTMAGRAHALVLERLTIERMPPDMAQYQALQEWHTRIAQYRIDYATLCQHYMTQYNVQSLTQHQPD